jgi:DNA-binding transcriptional LysR family regulator
VVTLHQLRIFATVVTEGTLSAAARRLQLSQPAVSLHIRELEVYFGCTLLVRARGGVRLTETGERALRYARRVLALVGEMEAALGCPAEEAAGHLLLGASTIPGEYLLPRLLAPFRTVFPRVDLTVEVTDTSTVLDRLLRRQYDVGLVGGTGHPDRLHFVPFATDELLLVAPTGHPLDRGEPVAPEELSHHTFVMREEGSATRDTIARALARAGLPALSTSAVTTSSEAVKQAVAAGVGLAFISAYALRQGPTPGLCIVPVRGLTIRRDLYVATELKHAPGRLADLFKSWLLSEPAQHILRDDSSADVAVAPRPTA